MKIEEEFPNLIIEKQTIMADDNWNLFEIRGEELKKKCLDKQRTLKIIKEEYTWLSDESDKIENMDQIWHIKTMERLTKLIKKLGLEEY